MGGGKSWIGIRQSHSNEQRAATELPFCVRKGCHEGIPCASVCLPYGVHGLSRKSPQSYYIFLNYARVGVLLYKKVYT